jgi:hypothetical protein
MLGVEFKPASLARRRERFIHRNEGTAVGRLRPCRIEHFELLGLRGRQAGEHETTIGRANVFGLVQGMGHG